ncbi:hypothetical protein ARMGADRAFT_1169769 [Armillaria gallica]|uniref:Heterokaryon incompatibility domain-containing protein n=1 Tax=Armillaria gallica TaxID=47427 RepID=A0A2H3CT34_ARMGA|nr:hypothetical protein ARMGADRAFT_1169769 [Armillaria gallica]
MNNGSQTNQTNNLPEVVVSAVAENGQHDSSIPAQKRQSLAGGTPIVLYSLTDLPFADLEIDAMMEFNDSVKASISHDLEEEQANRLPEVTLSAFIETGQQESNIPVLKQRSYTSGSKRVIPSALADMYCADFVIESYIARNDDFGTVYAHLRRCWKDDFADMEHYLRKYEEKAHEEEQNLLVNGRITTIYTGCRRVWDLYANRVVPYWAVRKPPWGISHAWLDGLCLRQEDGLREDLRAQEWMIDVPTIGWVFLDAKVVCYFCGLGRPLCLKPGFFTDDRCWFKRAWTLQEISEEMIIGGETGDDGTLEEDIQVTFREQLASLRQIRESHIVFDVLSEMKNWVSTKPLDKIAGLGYILDLRYLPIYDGAQSEEDAWGALVDAMLRYSRVNLLFFYPEPGDGSKCWRPSWNQIMTKIHPSRQMMSLWDGKFKSTDDPDDSANTYLGGHTDSGYVRGLSHPSHNGMPRHGELVVKDDTGSTHTFKIFADHTYPIPESSYTLLFQCDRNEKSDYYWRLLFWVVGQRRPDGEFEKLSVFRMLDDDKGTSIRKLGILKYAEMALC